ncbi:hypothetical protein [Haematobacter massiliensis]|nr:hypothetical protein [Haematobacter massiliensis]QBJ25965.1 hypothetical protein HmaOT1_16695 [Haematobacter massiliensis]
MTHAIPARNGIIARYLTRFTSRTTSQSQPELCQDEHVPVWRVDPGTGRIECRWSAEPAEIDDWTSRPWIARASLIRAMGQQRRLRGQ